MKIAIIGAGASGLVSAIKIKEKHPESEIFLFDRLDAVGKKIKATGNGKCNIGNVHAQFDGYSHIDFVKKIIGDYQQEEALLELGIPTKVMNHDGLYPVSESANNVVQILEKRAIQLGVNIILTTRLLDYILVNNQIELHFDKYHLLVDKALFCVGGKSNPNLGSDGSLFDVFARHGYQITLTQPGLCPIRIKENVTSLFGQRFHTLASLFIDGALIKEEYGEVMFKKDGLSGIVIMNLSSLIARNKAMKATIYLAVLNQNREIVSAKEIFELSKKGVDPLLAFVTSEIAKYIYHLAGVKPEQKLSYEQCEKIAKASSALPFTFNNFYDYEFSQVTIGGVAVENLNDDLSSKIEKNIYFLGEVIDVVGPCGGYNLRWAIGCAMRVAANI